MPQAPSQYDIEFYNLVHTLRAAANSPTGKGERRRRNRKPFSVTQWISPLRGDCDPGKPRSFFSVPCCDLNEGGFSFLLPSPPDFREVVVALGQPPEEILMIAAVAHWRQVDERPGKRRTQPMFQVGCRFLRRLRP